MDEKTYVTAEALEAEAIKASMEPRWELKPTAHRWASQLGNMRQLLIDEGFSSEEAFELIRAKAARSN
jgi:hypothetical protein